jgi:hypothetical protein
LSRNERTLELLCHLAGRPGHDEVKADFRQLLIVAALDFERRVPEVQGQPRVQTPLRTVAVMSDLKTAAPDDGAWGVAALLPEPRAMRRKSARTRFHRPRRDGAEPIDMETVAFIETELGDDLIVSLAVEDPTDRTEIQSKMNRDGRFRCVGL